MRNAAWWKEVGRCAFPMRAAELLLPTPTGRYSRYLLMGKAAFSTARVSAWVSIGPHNSTGAGCDPTNTNALYSRTNRPVASGLPSNDRIMTMYAPEGRTDTSIVAANRC